MPSDHSLVSTEEHELNYLLRKWKKMQSNNNKKVLIEKIEDFKNDEGYKPHNRKNFYRYIADKRILGLLEARKDANKGKGFLIPLIVSLVVIFIIAFVIIAFASGIIKYSGKQKTDEKSAVVEEIKKEEVKSKKRYTEESLKNFLKENTPIYFVKDSTDFVDGQKSKTKKIVSYLNNYSDIELLIEGHTANVGLPKNELALSKKRAKEIQNIIYSGVKTENKIFKVKGYGGTKEAVKNAKGSEQKLNRRVEIKIIKAISKDVFVNDVKQ